MDSGCGHVVVPVSYSVRFISVAPGRRRIQPSGGASVGRSVVRQSVSPSQSTKNQSCANCYVCKKANR